MPETIVSIDELVQERTRQLLTLQSSIIYVLADAVENRDQVIGGHIDRTTAYLTILIDEMVKQGVYADEIRGMDFDLLISSARLHDIGKITIPDAILNKSDKLTDEEFELMKTHASEGERIIDEIIAMAGTADFLHNARLFAGTHHERWDGGGYPHGLKDLDIPLHGRIMAIADVYDALVLERPYKKAFSHDEASGIIMDCAGTQFDPLIANVFFDVKDKFNAAKQSNFQNRKIKSL